MCHYSFTSMCSMCHHHHHVCQPSLPLSPGRGHNYPPSVSCTFEFDRSTPWTFYPPHIPTYPTFSVSYQSGLLFPSLLALPSPRSFIVTFCSFLYSIPTFLLTYLSTLSPLRLILGPPRLPANTFLQTCMRENVLLEIFATARDSFPFVASTAPGQDPLVAVLLFFSCRIRALTPLVPCQWMRQWSGSPLLV